jgi:hypothetical protein
MKTLLPVVSAGSAFAGGAVLGLVLGILAVSRSGNSLWAPAGLVIGGAIGAYSAFRILARAMR